MRLLKFSLVLLISILTAGCLQSLNPPYLNEDITYDPNLVGTWFTADLKSREKSENGALIFQPAKNPEIAPVYYVMTNENSASPTYIAHLVSIGKYQYLAFSPAAHAPDLMIPYYTLIRCSINKDVLNLWVFDQPWFAAEHQKGNMLDVSYQKIHDMGFFSGPSEEIRQWIAENEDQAFFSTDDGRFTYYRSKSSKNRTNIKQ